MNSIKQIVYFTELNSNWQSLRHLSNATFLANNHQGDEPFGTPRRFARRENCTLNLQLPRRPLGYLLVCDLLAL